MRGIKDNNNKGVLFETQPKERKKIISYSHGMKNNYKNIIKRGSMIKKSETVDNTNKKIIELLNKNDIKGGKRKMSLVNRDKSESAIVDLLDSDIKENKKSGLEKFNNKSNSKINILFED